MNALQTERTCFNFKVVAVAMESEFNWFFPFLQSLEIELGFDTLLDDRIKVKTQEHMSIGIEGAAQALSPIIKTGPLIYMFILNVFGII